MGRQLRRVPLDFYWPENKVYGGFINPHYKKSWECPHCSGSGESPQAKRLTDIWYGKTGDFRPEDRGSVPWKPEDAPVWAFAKRNVERSPEFYGEPSDFNIRREALRLCAHFNSQWSHHLNQDDVNALVEGDRLWDFTRDFVPGTGWVDKTEPSVPTAAEVNAWSIGGFGHDSCNQWIVVRAEAKRLGFETKCSSCNGEGRMWPSQEVRDAYENWTQEEPPIGEGYQLWETVSEGSPITPVFATAEELARHLAGTRWGADKGTPYETWMKFIVGPGWAPSGFIMNGEVMSGVEGVVDQD